MGSLWLTLIGITSIHAQSRSRHAFVASRGADHTWHRHRLETAAYNPAPNAPPSLAHVLMDKFISTGFNKENSVNAGRFFQKKEETANSRHFFSGGVQAAWVKQYGSQLLPNDEVATDIVTDRAGNAYVTGFQTHQPFGKDYFTVKYNTAGDKQWEARYNGENEGDEVAAAIVVDALGNVYITGGSEGNGAAADYVTIKYNSAGAELWVARYDWKRGGAESYDIATALTVDDGGNVYVTGWSENSLATIKYNATGIAQWSARHQGSNNNAANAIVVDQRGNVFVTGQCDGKFVAIKYNAAGREEWHSGFTGANTSHGLATAVALDDSDNVYVTGMYEGLGYPEFLTVKYNSAGTREWEAFYQGSEQYNWNIATALAVDDSGNVYVTGESGFYYEENELMREDIDFATIKYSHTGAVQWIARYGPAYDGSYATAVQVDRAGNVFVTGQDRHDYATVKYDAAGRQQWVTYYNGTGDTDDVATNLAIDEAGNVLVTGWSTGERYDKDYVTVKYNSAGFEQWTRRESHPSNSFDVAASLALDENGNVYVTGSSQNTGNAARPPAEWATLMYNAAGAIKWVARDQQAANFQNAASKLAVDAAGNVYVIGSRYDLTRQFHQYGMLAKYDHNGSALWRVAFDSTSAEGYSVPTVLTCDRFGNVYVTGTSHGANFVTIKYEATGDVRWVARENMNSNSLSGAAALALDDSGNVYVAGHHDDEGVTVKYDANGLSRWRTLYHPPDGVNRIVALAIEPLKIGGNIVVLAEAGHDADYVTIKYNRAGAQQWEARYSRTENSFDHPAALTLDATGNVYVTGDAGTIKYTSAGAASWIVPTAAIAMAVDASGNLYTTGCLADSLGGDFFTMKYNSSGAAEWSARYDGPGNSDDCPVALALDNSGNVYVAGQSRAAISRQWSYFTTIKYTQTAVSVRNESPHLPAKFELAQNYPNPFSASGTFGHPSTVIRYNLAQSSYVTLEIFDILGREVATLVNEIKPAGEYDVQWTPIELSSGVYIYRLQVADPALGRAGGASVRSGQSFVESKKLVIIP
ncbi:MAG: hypothetical protein ALAOOOJD_00921 [bacterium]|nr:hypothetical protein [bacterium]